MRAIRCVKKFLLLGLVVQLILLLLYVLKNLSAFNNEVKVHTIYVKEHVRSNNISRSRNVTERPELTVPDAIVKAVGEGEWLCRTITDTQNVCQAIQQNDTNYSKTSSDMNCKIPNLDPFHPSIIGLISNVRNPDCSKQRSYGSLSNGKLTFNDRAVVSATYRRIVRDGDFKIVLGSVTPVAPNSTITDQFVQVEYVLKGGKRMQELFLQPVPYERLLARKGDKKPGIPLNILIIGVDSLSHSNTKRKLPKLYELLKKKLGAFIFNGHSIVGDGTTEQLAAMLTGLGELEQYESRRHHKNPKPVDGWNWIYKQLKEHGYLTGYSGDNPSIGPFQYRLMGFKDEPTDFYTRPFYQRVLKLKKEARAGRNKCIAKKTISKFQLDYTLDVFSMFSKQLKFFFSFNVEYSHNSNNEAAMIEPDLVSFLKEFQEKGYLNNTLLILMGDHGNRYGKVRELLQGRLEERLPLFALAFPSWFTKHYPEITKNLAINVDRLTSWYDVYATFRHMLSYPLVPKDLKHGKSLFEEIPPTRTCADATVEQHWCPCLKMSPVSVNHSHVRNAALASVEYMNKAINEHELSAQYCEVLSLKTINYALLERPNQEVLSFKQSDDLKPVFVKGAIAKEENYCRYQLQFTTSPNNGVYEATVRYYKNWFLVSHGISRVNKYGDQPVCIAKELPHLRKFCLCLRTA